VFGDLNYRIDPGVVTGIGWNTMWKKGNDAASGSIAAGLQVLAAKTTKSKSTKAAFAAVAGRLFRTCFSPTLNFLLLLRTLRASVRAITLKVSPAPISVEYLFSVTLLRGGERAG
jgi:hypothetical protein